MFLASQLADISSRFPAHVEEIRKFLLKEKLPVPSPDAIPELSGRLGRDGRFRADVGSLLRATLYQEREQIGHEDLLGILVTAAAGTEHDLKSDSQEADIREMLRFVLQSRRSAFRPDPEPEEPGVAAEAEPRETVPVDSEPVLRARAMEPGRFSMKLELKSDETPANVAAADSREPGDVVLQPLRTAGLFAAYQDAKPSSSRTRSLWIVGVVCMLMGVGLGLTFHRVVSAAEGHAARTSGHATTAGSIARNEPKVAARGDANLLAKDSPVTVERLDGGGVGAKKSESLAGAGQTAGGGEGGEVQPAAVQGGPTARPAAESSSAVPMTVVKQVVMASPGPSQDSGESDTTQATAKTRSIVRQGPAGMKAANVIFSPAPEYPAEAAAARVHGEVTVHAVVDPDGKVIYARAVSGPPLLRDAAQQAVQRWRYSPLLDNGKPIAVTTVAIVDFKVAR